MESIVNSFDKDGKIWEECIRQNFINPTLSISGMYIYYMNSYIGELMKGVKDYEL